MATAIAAPTFALVLAVVAAPRLLCAAEQRYEVSAGESLEAIAAKVYGNAELADWLGSFNRLTAPPRAGDALRLPGAERYEAVEGDTWAVLAERSLGSADLADDLARLNGRAPDEPLAPGDSVRLPAVAPYRVVAGDSLARVSRRFYASPELAGLLARMNALSNASHVVVGRTLQVPIPHVVTQSDAASAPEPEREEPAAESSLDVDPATPPALAAVEAPPPDPVETREDDRPAQPREPTKPEVATPKPAPKAAAKPTPAPLAPPPPVAAPPPAKPAAAEFADALRAAENAYLDGRYDVARDALEQLRSEVLARGTPAEQRALLRQLTFVYVAYDRTSDACTAWRALRKVDGDTQLDPNLVSPKIRSAVSGCAR